MCKLFHVNLETKLGNKRDGLKQCKFINSKKLYGFSNYKKFNFIKIKCYNLSSFYECRRIIEGRYPYGKNKSMKRMVYVKIDYLKLKEKNMIFQINYMNQILLQCYDFFILEIYNQMGGWNLINIL